MVSQFQIVRYPSVAHFFAVIAALNCFLTFVKMSYHASAVWPPPVAWATTAAMRPLLVSLNVCIPMSFARLVTMRMHAFSDKVTSLQLCDLRRSEDGAEDADLLPLLL